MDTVFYLIFSIDLIMSNENKYERNKIVKAGSEIYTLSSSLLCIFPVYWSNLGVVILSSYRHQHGGKKFSKLPI